MLTLENVVSEIKQTMLEGEYKNTCVYGLKCRLNDTILSSIFSDDCYRSGMEPKSCYFEWFGLKETNFDIYKEIEPLINFLNYQEQVMDHRMSPYCYGKLDHNKAKEDQEKVVALFGQEFVMNITSRPRI